jgi:UDP-hydrolysing UDP-N-acetyl-D-glucosamine 2-epimerase
MLLSADTPEAVAKSMGLGVIGFAQSYRTLRPDILLVLGDRFEMHSAVTAALPFGIPVAHIHGGESTEGAIDDALRHSITKMSHLHFAATELYRDQIVQMGEEPWRVTVSGAPGLDNLRVVKVLSRGELDKRYCLERDRPFCLVTYHPETLDYRHTEGHTKELLAALERVKATLVFTYPSADAGGRVIIGMIEQFARDHANARVVANLGTHVYFSMMRHAVAMIGNSSSGILEAASFALPVVNIGNRQQGRLRARNVIDVGHSRSEITVGVHRAMSREFRAGLTGLENPYGDGRASDRIVERLRSVKLTNELLRKHFHRL